MGEIFVFGVKNTNKTIYSLKIDLLLHATKIYSEEEPYESVEKACQFFAYLWSGSIMLKESLKRIKNIFFPD